MILFIISHQVNGITCSLIVSGASRAVVGGRFSGTLHDQATTRLLLRAKACIMILLYGNCSQNYDQ